VRNYQTEQSPQETAYAISVMMAFSQKKYAWPLDADIQSVSSLAVDQIIQNVAGTTNKFAEQIALIPQRQIDWLTFQWYAEAWKKSRPKASSSAIQVAFDPNYLRIIAMADRAIPCLLKRLQNELETGEPDHWFVALWAVTDGQNPVPPESRGKMREMAKAWIEWGKQRGFLDAGMGGGLSQSW
jgi:hypothetical protein